MMNKEILDKKVEIQPIGRPPMYKSAEDMQTKIDEYFIEECKTIPIYNSEGMQIVDTKGRPVIQYNPPTVSGLALFLGFADRISLYEYANKPEFTNTIKKAMSRMEEFAEKQLHIGNSTGAIFWLKNRGHNWSDKQTVENLYPEGKPDTQTPVLERIAEILDTNNQKKENDRTSKSKV